MLFTVISGRKHLVEFHFHPHDAEFHVENLLKVEIVVQTHRCWNWIEYNFGYQKSTRQNLEWQQLYTEQCVLKWYQLPCYSYIFDFRIEAFTHGLNGFCYAFVLDNVFDIGNNFPEAFKIAFIWIRNLLKWQMWSLFIRFLNYCFSDGLQPKLPAQLFDVI